MSPARHPRHSPFDSAEEPVNSSSTPSTSTQSNRDIIALRIALQLSCLSLPGVNESTPSTADLAQNISVLFTEIASSTISQLLKDAVDQVPAMQALTAELKLAREAGEHEKTTLREALAEEKTAREALEARLVAVEASLGSIGPYITCSKAVGDKDAEQMVVERCSSAATIEEEKLAEVRGRKRSRKDEPGLEEEQKSSMSSGILEQMAERIEMLEEEAGKLTDVLSIVQKLEDESDAARRTDSYNQTFIDNRFAQHTTAINKLEKRPMTDCAYYSRLKRPIPSRAAAIFPRTLPNFRPLFTLTSSFIDPTDTTWIPPASLKPSTMVNDHRPLNLLSQTVGPLVPALSPHTLGEHFSHTAAQYQDSPAFISLWERPDQHDTSCPAGGIRPGEDCLRWSFAQMEREVLRAERALRAIGLKKGDRVGVLLGNGSAYVALQWATAKLGIIFATINPASKGPELVSALSLTTCRALFISPTIRNTNFLETLHQLLPALSGSNPHGLQDVSLPELKSIVLVDNTNIGAESFAAFLEEEKVGGMGWRDVLEQSGIEKKLVGEPEKLFSQEVINLQFTSGTTGLPKAVALTHHNLLNNGFLIGECMKLRPPAPEDGWHGEKLCNSPPMFHCFGTGIAAGSPVPDEIMRKLIKRMNLCDIVITYGQTETSPATIMSTTDSPVSLRCTTVGQVLPHTSIRIVDTSHPLYPSPVTPSIPIDTPGELWSAGYAVMDGYWENQEETDKVVFTDEGGLRWMRTGDEAVMDAEGYVSIVGRMKDIIIRGGENIFPVVVEARALLLPGIADCSVIAVPCRRMMEAVGAFVQREDSEAGRNVTAEQLSDHIDRLMSHQAKPEWIWWLGEDGVQAEFPKTASGKIVRTLSIPTSRKF
ncbi:hypothetical protein P7C70_g1067, partial [Phenoliferia sp. Uapishka_3]